jgi:hypothetical protein
MEFKFEPYQNTPPLQPIFEEAKPNPIEELGSSIHCPEILDNSGTCVECNQIFNDLINHISSNHTYRCKVSQWLLTLCKYGICKNNPYGFANENHYYTHIITHINMPITIARIVESQQSKMLCKT